MSPLEILKHLRRRPFLPLRLFISDGSFYDIPHPELATVSRTTVAIAVELRESDVPDRLVYCDPIRITRVEPLEEAAAKAGEAGSGDWRPATGRASLGQTGCGGKVPGT